MKKITITILCAVALAACATQPIHAVDNAPGFFSGFLHGLIIWFSLVAGLFFDVRIYSFPNSGLWYDFGFALGATMSLGAASRAP